MKISAPLALKIFWLWKEAEIGLLVMAVNIRGVSDLDPTRPGPRAEAQPEGVFGYPDFFLKNLRLTVGDAKKRDPSEY